MMIIKNNKGFSLIEVLLAIAIVGVAIMPLLMTMGRSSTSASRKAALYDRVLAGYSFLIEKAFVPEKKEDDAKKIDNPRVELRYSSAELAENSSLSDIENLVSDQVKIEWITRGVKQEERVVYLSYQPEKKKS